MKRGGQAGNKSSLSHGHARRGRHSPEYQCWTDIKTRCLKPTFKHFKYYGGRGITICDEWKESFESFLAHIGPRPTPKHTIDRYPDNDGNYEPGNVRWATRLEQVENRSNNVKVTVAGEKMTVSQACRRFGFPDKLVRTRLGYGWSIEEALSPPRWSRTKKSEKS